MFSSSAIKKSLFFILISSLAWAAKGQSAIGRTEICKWQYNKKGAVSITYDDGSINQFRYALPVMEKLKLPATFFIITGGLPGSKYHGKFIGRPVKNIIAETIAIPTNPQNFFERCSAAGYLGYKGTIVYHTQAAALYDEGKHDEAFKLMDTLYKKVRNGEFKPGYQPCDEVLQEKGSTWDDFRQDAAKGYEFASHSVTHASMPALDSANIIYELEKSKQEIKDKLGEQYTFSAEVPYGFEDSRLMKYAYRIYPALRNRMPEPWLKEIDRASSDMPGNTVKDYVQWQRGMTTKTPLPLMQSWVDTTTARHDTWLVLVIHGVDGLGYEALPHTLLQTYFEFIKDRENMLWVATFGDVTKYMRERESARLTNRVNYNSIKVRLTDTLNSKMYNIPLTLKTYVPAKWRSVDVQQAKHFQQEIVLHDDKGPYVIYLAKINNGDIKLTPRR